MGSKDRAPDLQPACVDSDTSETTVNDNEVAVAYQAYYAALVRYLERITRSRRDAEDAAQEAFRKLLSLDRPISVLEQYVWKTGANCARDMRRKRLIRERLNPVALFEPVVTAPSPESWLDARQRLELINRAIDELPSKCRLVFIRRVLEEHSFEDIASELGISERMVQAYLGRALEYCQRVIDRAAEAKGEGKR